MLSGEVFEDDADIELAPSVFLPTLVELDNLPRDASMARKDLSWKFAAAYCESCKRYNEEASRKAVASAVEAVMPWHGKGGVIYVVYRGNEIVAQREAPSPT